MFKNTNACVADKSSAYIMGIALINAVILEN